MCQQTYRMTGFTNISKTSKPKEKYENPTDNYMGFSDVNTMPRTDSIRQYFEVETWVGDPYPDYIETDLTDWAKAMDKSVHDRQETFKKYSRAFSFLKENKKENVKRK